MDDRAPSSFLEVLPEEVTEEGLLPVSFALLAPDDPPRVMPWAESRHHRAEAYVCFPFYKPISRCFRREE